MAIATHQTATGSSRHRAVYALRNSPDEPEHERLTHLAMVARIAALLKLPCGGECTVPAERPCYLVPDDTIVGLDSAAALGVRGENDLFGGVVPHPFQATKAITHPLVEPGASAPAGWAQAFAAATQGTVLPGFTAFSAEDALRAGERLQRSGRVRVKPTRGRAGRGQVVATDIAGLHSTIGRIDPDELSTFGLVLEEDLSDIVTFSVGQVRVAGLSASYCGTQRLARNNEGKAVYGGSDLMVVRGGVHALARLGLGEAALVAVEKAREYDAAAWRCYPGLCASRRNYDVALGTDARGRRRCGVLEQSWRIGGATPAEIVALEMFSREPSLAAVHASCFEVYGDRPSIPPDAVVFFSGRDEQAGPLVKYARAEPYGRAEREG